MNSLMCLVTISPTFRSIPYIKVLYMVYMVYMVYIGAYCINYLNSNYFFFFR